MPRNGSSVYSLPAGNPVVPGTVIATTWANTTLTDIATALTNSLSTDGSTASVSLSGKTMTGGNFSFPAISGTLNLIGGNILFPAVQIPSANANMLDDYEEGTWTPVITFNTPGNLNVVYTSQVGTYVKIGKQVHVELTLASSTFTFTTASGNALITGVPFTYTGTQSTFPMSSSTGLSSLAGFTQICWILTGGSPVTLLFRVMNVPTGTVANATTSAFATGTNIGLSGCGSFVAA